MDGARFSWQFLLVRLVSSLVAPSLLALSGATLADQPVPPARLPAVEASVPDAPAPVQVLDLCACKALALQKQPAIAAAQASFAVAIARQQALEKLCVPTFLQRDLPKRREQAALGITAAQEGVRQAEIDTLFAVQFCYVSYLYANAQNRLVDDVLRQIQRLHKELKELEKAGDKEAPALVAKVEALNLLVDGRRAEAVIGAQRALSSLREAIGLDGECLLVQDLPALPAPCVTPDLKEVVALALERRPEIIQASIGAQVSNLEICAQRARLLSLTVWTFAAGSDIHANPLPSASFWPNYRPGAVGPEMPVTINGKRGDRVEQARIYNSRAHSVLEKTQNLIRLETEQAFFRWKEASVKLANFHRGVERARVALPDLEKAGTIPRTPVALATFLDTARLLTDLRFELNRARYEMLVALIALERATAGGFCAGLDKAPLAAEPARSGAAPTSAGRSGPRSEQPQRSDTGATLREQRPRSRRSGEVWAAERTIRQAAGEVGQGR
jgi:outer membrane protein TolC